MQTVQTWEGYYNEGSFHTYEPIPIIPRDRRILITVLDDRLAPKRGTWEEFDRFVDEIDEKLHFEDFTRCQLSRPLIDFDEV